MAIRLDKVFGGGARAWYQLQADDDLAKAMTQLAEKTNYLIEDLADHDYGTLPDIVFLQVVSAIMTKECSKKDSLILEKQKFIETWATTTSVAAQEVSPVA